MITAMKSRSFRLLLTIFAALALPATRAGAADHGEAKKAPAHAAPSAARAKPKATPVKHESATTGGEHARPVGEQTDTAPSMHEPAPVLAPAPAPVHASTPVDTPTAAQAMALLMEGNARYMADKPQTIRADARRRSETANGQKPSVTIVSCSDSTVPPELIFDRGIGELFIVRVAGNVCGGDELGSVEYAVNHLHTPLVLVMGHTKCEAVRAAASGAEMPGHISRLMKNINPAVESARKAHPELAGEAIVPEAIVANVYRGIEQMLTESDILREHARSGRVRIEAVIYDIAKGKIDWLGQHPRQSDLLRASATHTKGGKPEGAVAVSHEKPPVLAGATIHADVPAADTHAAPVPVTAMREALVESAHKEQVAVHASAVPVQASVATRPAVMVMEPPVQPTPHALPGLLERCMAEELYRLGARHLEAGEYAEAASRFQAAAGIDPSMLAARNDLAGVYCMQQKYSEALELYTAILEVDGQYRFAMRGAALCHASMRHYDQARAMLNRLLSLDRRDARTWLELGDVCFLDNDANAARQFWTTAAQVNAAAADVVKQAKLRLKVYAVSPPAANAQAAR